MICCTCSLRTATEPAKLNASGYPKQGTCSPQERTKHSPFYRHFP
nr:MAG TPA: hypothetical protein [Caudoviricetes sp.]